MELLIVICLLIIIVLLLKGKFMINKKSYDRPKQEKVNPELPDIMGQPKPAKGYEGQDTRIGRKGIEPENKDANTNSVHSEQIPTAAPFPQQVQDDGATTPIDLEEEQEYWGTNGVLADDGFATGITFDQLAGMGKLLVQNALEPSEEKMVVSIASKIDGTELLGLLESKIGDASKKIAMLLNRGLARQLHEGSSLLRNNGSEDFDIGDYI